MRDLAVSLVQITSDHADWQFAVRCFRNTQVIIQQLTPDRYSIQIVCSVTIFRTHGRQTLCKSTYSLFEHIADRRHSLLLEREYLCIFFIIVFQAPDSVATELISRPNSIIYYAIPFTLLKSIYYYRCIVPGVIIDPSKSKTISIDQYFQS